MEVGRNEVWLSVGSEPYSELNAVSLSVGIYLESTIFVLDDGLCVPLQTHTYAVRCRLLFFNK